jgi:hypothetical protein
VVRWNRLFLLDVLWNMLLGIWDFVLFIYYEIMSLRDYLVDAILFFDLVILNLFEKTIVFDILIMSLMTPKYLKAVVFVEDKNDLFT